MPRANKRGGGSKSYNSYNPGPSTSRNVSRNNKRKYSGNHYDNYSPREFRYGKIFDDLLNKLEIINHKYSYGNQKGPKKAKTETKSSSSSNENGLNCRDFREDLNQGLVTKTVYNNTNLYGPMPYSKVTICDYVLKAHYCDLSNHCTIRHHEAMLVDRPYHIAKTKIKGYRGELVNTLAVIYGTIKIKKFSVHLKIYVVPNWCQDYPLVIGRTFAEHDKIWYSNIDLYVLFSEETFIPRPPTTAIVKNTKMICQTIAVNPAKRICQGLAAETVVSNSCKINPIPNNSQIKPAETTQVIIKSAPKIPLNNNQASCSYEVKETRIEKMQINCDVHNIPNIITKEFANQNYNLVIDPNNEKICDKDKTSQELNPTKIQHFQHPFVVDIDPEQNLFDDIDLTVDDEKITVNDTQNYSDFENNFKPLEVKICENNPEASDQVLCKAEETDQKEDTTCDLNNIIPNILLNSEVENEVSNTAENCNNFDDDLKAIDDLEPEISVNEIQHTNLSIDVPEVDLPNEDEQETFTDTQNCNLTALENPDPEISENTFIEIVSPETSNESFVFLKNLGTKNNFFDFTFEDEMKCFTTQNYSDFENKPENKIENASLKKYKEEHTNSSIDVGQVDSTSEGESETFTHTQIGNLIALDSEISEDTIIEILSSEASNECSRATEFLTALENLDPNISENTIIEIVCSEASNESSRETEHTSSNLSNDVPKITFVEDENKTFAESSNPLTLENLKLEATDNKIKNAFSEGPAQFLISFEKKDINEKEEPPTYNLSNEVPKIILTSEDYTNNNFEAKLKFSDNLETSGNNMQNVNLEASDQPQIVLSGEDEKKTPTQNYNNLDDNLNFVPEISENMKNKSDQTLIILEKQHTDEKKELSYDLSNDVPKTLQIPETADNKMKNLSSEATDIIPQEELLEPEEEIESFDIDIDIDDDTDEESKIEENNNISSDSLGDSENEETSQWLCGLEEEFIFDLYL